MRITRLAALLGPGLALLAGCGGGGDGRDGGLDGGDGGLTCGPAELRLQGSLDGQAVDWSYPVAGQTVDNTPADVPCRAVVMLDNPGGRLLLEWPLPLVEGGASEARATLNLEARGGPAVGNCAADGFPSRITRFSSAGLEFELEDLHEAPACSGASVPGALQGCASFP